MLIDWFTFFAQLINFLVLVWLLKRFLYKPILKAIDEREKRIAMQLKEAETLKKEATIELNNFQHKNNELDRHRQELLDGAKKEVNAERQRLIEQTRSNIEKLRLDLQETIRKEQENLSSEIVQRTSKQVFSIVRKTLHDLASVSLEEQMTDVFIAQLENMDSNEKGIMLSGIEKVRSNVILRCTFELPTVQQSKIIEILKKELVKDIKITFETAPDLLSGIELIAGGHKLVWNINDYLISLEKSIAELITKK